MNVYYVPFYRHLLKVLSRWPKYKNEQHRQKFMPSWRLKHPEHEVRNVINYSGCGKVLSVGNYKGIVSRRLGTVCFNECGPGTAHDKDDTRARTWAQRGRGRTAGTRSTHSGVQGECGQPGRPCTLNLPPTSMSSGWRQTSHFSSPRIAHPLPVFSLPELPTSSPTLPQQGFAAGFTGKKRPRKQLGGTLRAPSLPSPDLRPPADLPSPCRAEAPTKAHSDDNPLLPPSTVSFLHQPRGPPPGPAFCSGRVHSYLPLGRAVSTLHRNPVVRAKSSS